jgi:histidyl-tRNA synthetase
VGIESIGLQDPEIDAEVISVADAAFKRLGISDYHLEITSLGDSITRERYTKELRSFISTLKLDEATAQRANLNPLRLFDDKRPEVQAVISGAPILMDYLTPESAEHFASVKECLEVFGISYQVNNRMVRGLDYYTGTAFEFVHHKLGAQSGIGGGGRYDGLMAQLGGADLSGIGFGLGVDRILMACEAEEIALPADMTLTLFIVPINEAAKRQAVSSARELRLQGISVDLAYGDRNLKSGMKAADKSGARFALVLGEDEITSGVAQLKNMQTGDSFSVTIRTLHEDLRKVLF